MTTGYMENGGGSVTNVYRHVKPDIDNVEKRTYCNKPPGVSDDLPGSSDILFSCRMISKLSGRLVTATLPEVQAICKQASLQILSTLVLTCLSAMSADAARYLPLHFRGLTLRLVALSPSKATQTM